ncbi:MAG: acyl carrier protein [Pseudonocardia sp.]|nr:acyl carrier protein [Pseudonocardia sp.]
MITVDEVATRIRREMRGKLPTGTVITADTNLNDLGLSSLQISEVVFSLEDDHGFEFDTARAADIKSVGEVVALANESLAASQS